MNQLKQSIKYTPLASGFHQDDITFLVASRSPTLPKTNISHLKMDDWKRMGGSNYGTTFEVTMMSNLQQPNGP